MHVDPSDTILEVKQRIQELLQQVQMNSGLDRLPYTLCPAFMFIGIAALGS